MTRCDLWRQQSLGEAFNDAQSVLCSMPGSVGAQKFDALYAVGSQIKDIASKPVHILLSLVRRNHEQ